MKIHYCLKNRSINLFRLFGRFSLCNPRWQTLLLTYNITAFIYIYIVPLICPTVNTGSRKNLLTVNFK